MKTMMLLGCAIVASCGFCFAETNNVKTNIESKMQNLATPFIDSKVFSEDSVLIEAADLFINGKYLEADTIYERLLKETNDAYFIKQRALMQNEAGNFDKAVSFALEYQRKSGDADDVDTNAIIAESYIRNGNYNLAITTLEKIVAKESILHFHYILSNLYVQTKQYKKAIKHLLIVYRDSMSDGTKLKIEAVSRIVALHVELNEVDKALNYIDDFIANEETESNIESFIGVYVKYAESEKLENLQDSLLKHFNRFQNMQNARFVIALMIQRQKHDDAILFLKENSSILGQEGREILMQVYANDNKFQEAFMLAKGLYNDTKMLDFLGLSAVYQYEILESKNEETLAPIIDTLEKVIKSRSETHKQELNKEDAFFYNFLGYLLIDHDIDPKAGLNYVSVAISIEPESPEYLDSLAWGFYKNDNCQKAKETFELIPDSKVKDIEELQKHKELIFKCN